MKYTIPVFFLLFLISILSIHPAKALSYDPGFLIADIDLLSGQPMAYTDIQSFLEGHSGVLKNYYSVDVDGMLKTAAMIIHDAAARNHINPRFLLVLLQKEQGLITDPSPYDSQISWATGYALCDSCSPDHPIVVKYKGFAQQLDNAASRISQFMAQGDQFYFQPGQTYSIDGQEVHILNQATAALYDYTPHLQGNKIFFKLWDSWFASAIPYPDGSLLQAIGQPGVWLLKNGQKHPFTSYPAFASRYSKTQIIQVSSAVLDQYPAGDAISYPEFSVLRTQNGDVYLIANDEKRLIVDDFTFKQLGFSPDEIVDVTDTEISFFPRGADITPQSLEPLGSLIQDPETYGIYFVKDGVKRPLIAPELLSLDFPNLTVRKASTDELDHYTKGDPVTIKDGYLVKAPSDPTVYVISNGLKHPIDSEETFVGLGYKWDNIHTVTDKLLALHPLGDAISLTQTLSDQQAEQLVDPTNTAGVNN